MAYEYIKHPNHYGGENNPYEAIKVIQAWDLDFELGSAVKYISRAGKKPNESSIRDLKKVIEYVQFEIDKIEERERNRELTEYEKEALTESVFEQLCEKQTSYELTRAKI